MADLPVELVAELLATACLIGPEFHPATIAADLNASVEAAATLDQLLDDAPPTDPVAFDPRWR